MEVSGNGVSGMGASGGNAAGDRPRVAVVGGGFGGLAAAYELGRLGIRAVVLEADPEVGGLAGSFPAGGAPLEKFYHHWFSGDVEVMRLVAELGREDRVLERATRTGAYYAHDFFRLSTPLDLLRFTPLPFLDRLRLGALALRARRVKDWRRLEERTAADWLRELGGQRAYEVVWEPLLRGKFGDLAEEVAAVWMWNKLKLRGGSRGRRGEERLAFYRGGFAALAGEVVAAIRSRGGEVRVGTPVTGLSVADGRVTGCLTPEGPVAADAALLTPALPIVADLVEPHTPKPYVENLRRIRYLASLCVVLELDRSLSDIYWLNVNDPGFPFVGVIEHTNFEPSSSYGGRHIVYLSKYLPETDPLYRTPDPEVVAFSLGHLRRMFPDLSEESVLAAHVWRARYAQPVVERGYRRLVPEARTPIGNLFLSTMAQIYPEDRGTNYAIGRGRETAKALARELLAGRGLSPPGSRTVGGDDSE